MLDCLVKRARRSMSSFRLCFVSIPVFWSFRNINCDNVVWLRCCFWSSISWQKYLLIIRLTTPSQFLILSSVSTAFRWHSFLREDEPQTRNLVGRLVKGVGKIKVDWFSLGLIQSKKAPSFESPCCTKEGRNTNEISNTFELGRNTVSKIQLAYYEF